MTWLSAVLATLTAFGCLYLVVAFVLVGAFARRRAPPAAQQPAVTILKPLHGDEPGLAANLDSFCRQDYAAPVQIVLGLHGADDAALPIARALVARFPDRQIDLIVDERQHGLNGKVSNLINMEASIRHEVVILSDSDIRVAPDWLSRMIDTLAQPGVGAVTCLYHGLPETRCLWSSLSALNIDAHFLPNAIVGIQTGFAHPCFGSAIALRRETLAAIGGFAPLSDSLADDYVLGEAVRLMAGRIALPALSVGHGCPERSFRELWQHDLRWARTIRSIDPLGHLGSAITHPLPFALLWLAAAPGTLPLAALLTAVTCRIALCMRIEQHLGADSHAYGLLPVRDCLSFAVFLASFLGRGVRWKGQAFSVVRDGTLAHDRRSTLP